MARGWGPAQLKEEDTSMLLEVKDLRVRAEDKSIRLIALTGYGQPDDRRRALEAGFDAHLVKPVDFETLDEAIRAPRAEP